MSIWLNLKLFYCGMFFETVDYIFRLKKLLYIFFFITFCRFWRFRQIDLAQENRSIEMLINNIYSILDKNKKKAISGVLLRYA